MKKFSLFALLGLFMSVFAFTACGSDDDDNGSTNNPLVGTWYTEVFKYTEVTFNADFTCTRREYAPGSTTAIIDSDTGTYEIKGNKLSIWWESERKFWNNGPWTTTFSISGKKMTTTEGDGIVWTKK